MVHHCPKELLIWHSTVLSFGQMAQLIMIILSLTASTPQNVFPMVHTLIWPIWPIWPIRPMLQNLSKTLLYTIVYTGILHLPYVCGLCIVPVFPSRDGTMVLLVIKILKLLYNTPWTLLIKYHSFHALLNP